MIAPGSAKVPHVWHTRDADGSEVQHLAMCEYGAVQAHYLHHGMIYYDKVIVAQDDGDN